MYEPSGSNMTVHRSCDKCSCADWVHVIAMDWITLESKTNEQIVVIEEAFWIPLISRLLLIANNQATGTEEKNIHSSYHVDVAETSEI